MAIEKARIVKTLKCGNNMYPVGMVFEKPIPQDIFNEINLKTGTVEVLLESRKPEPKLKEPEVVVEEVQEEEETEETTQEEEKTEEEEEESQTAEEKEGKSRLIT